jgi:ABC-type multidrug transport system ATPase subunit
MTNAALETEERATVKPHEPGVDAEIVVSVEDVTKVYRPLPPPGRVLRMMMRFGGGGSYRDRLTADDDDDDDEGLDDAGDAEPVEEQVGGRDVAALGGVSFTVAAGTCVALVGPTRAGKSTLLRIVAGLTPPSSGRVVLAGRVAPVLDDLVRALPARLSLRKAALVLASMTRMPRREIERQLPEAFARIGMDGQENRLVSNTTGKRRRQLMLSVLTSARPLILLYDAPMPPAGRAFILERIDELRAAGGAVIVTSRDVETVNFADRVLYLQRGRIVAEGAPSEVLDELRRTRAAGNELPQAELSDDAARLAEFLRMGRGVLALEDALHHAIAAAVESGHDLVAWEALAEAAGLPLEEAHTVVERLRVAHAPQYRREG